MLSLKKLNISLKIRRAILIAPVIIAASCDDDLSYDIEQPVETIECIANLSLSVTPGFGEDPASRSTSVGLVNENDIKDFWLIEYDQNGNRIGFPRYFNFDNSNPKVSIIVPTDRSHVFTGVILANTHNKDLFNEENDYSLSEDRMKTMYDEIRQESEVYTTLTTQSGKTEHYLPMSCTFEIQAPQTAGAIPSYECKLRRNVAKVVMQLKTDGVTIDSVMWRNVPEKRYIAERLLHNIEINTSTFNQVYANPIEPDVKELDWSVERISAEQNTTAKDKGLELVYYLPRSCWGKSGSATSAKDKNRSAPDKATYFEILATNTKVAGSSGLRFKLYPGMDNTTDFNIFANCCYTYPVTLTTVTEGDSRVEDLNNVRLPESNSYIINPAKHVTYEIPISRINKFWTNDEVDPNHLSYVLADDSEWIAEVIWQDQDQKMIQFCTATSDSPLTTYNGTGNTSFFIRTVANAPAGNVVIGVRKKPDNGVDPSPKNREYLWSWHLWMTDYDPDQWNLAWIDGQYKYPVAGGEIHRYTSSYWETTFHNKYMMDRNLGAYSADPGTNNDKISDTFGLYYQY